jgi:hypothetical protein
MEGKGSSKLTALIYPREAVFRESGQTQLFQQDLTTRINSMEQSSKSIPRGLKKQDVQLRQNNDVSNKILESLQG